MKQKYKKEQQNCEIELMRLRANVNILLLLSSFSRYSNFNDQLKELERKHQSVSIINLMP